MAARTFLDLPLDLIDDGPNVRTKADAGLRRSVEDVGVLQPITVAPLEDDRYVCLYGHRRLAAARAARLATIPAIVEKAPDELPIRQLIENQQRRSVDAMDVARTLRAFLDDHPGMTQAQLAAKLGRSQYWVSQKLTLLDMTPALQARVAAGEIRDDQAVQVHRASTIQQKRSRPRILEADAEDGRSSSVVVPLGSANKKGEARATISLDHVTGAIELLVEDGSGYGVMLTLAADTAKLLGLRLNQAYQAARAAA
jgi:ParB/RepB/Spo0J family partition protein